MKVIDAKVRWSDGFSNDPTFEVLVDQDRNCWYSNHPCVKDRIYNNPKVIWNTKEYPKANRIIETFAWCLEDGFVHFFYHNPMNQSGFGGSVYDIYTSDGLKHFKGPWSSGESFASKVIGVPLFGGAMTCDPPSFKQRYTFSSSSFTLDIAKEAAKFAKVELVPVEIPDRSNDDAEISSEQASVVFHGIKADKFKTSWMIKHPNKPLKCEIPLRERQTNPLSYRD